MRFKMDSVVGSIFIALFVGVLGGALLQAWATPPKAALTAIPTAQEQSYGTEWMQMAPEEPTSEYKRQTCKGSYQCRLMATALVYEARGESTRGMVAVAYVILTRVESPKWPNTIAGVIHQKRKGVCQFSYVCQKKQASKEEDWLRAYDVAYDVLNSLVENTAPGADHYHTTAVNPVWDNNMQLVMLIGDHEFYRER